MKIKTQLDSIFTLHTCTDLTINKFIQNDLLHKSVSQRKKNHQISLCIYIASENYFMAKKIYFSQPQEQIEISLSFVKITKLQGAWLCQKGRCNFCKTEKLLNVIHQNKEVVEASDK